MDSTREVHFTIKERGGSVGGVVQKVWETHQKNDVYNEGNDLTLGERLSLKQNVQKHKCHEPCTVHEYFKSTYSRRLCFMYRLTRPFVSCLSSNLSPPSETTVPLYTIPGRLREGPFQPPFPSSLLYNLLCLVILQSRLSSPNRDGHNNEEKGEMRFEDFDRFENHKQMECHRSKKRIFIGGGVH